MKEKQDNQPTLTPPNEWVRVEDAMPPEHEPVLCIVDGNPKPNITLEDAYQIGSWNKADGWIIDEYLDWEDADVSWWMSLPAPPDKDNNVLAKTPNEPLTLEQLRQMDEIPIYVVTEKYGSGWCVLNWHGVKKSYTYFSRTGTSEGMTATPLSAKTYGDLWIAYRRPPEGEEDT